jgi:hypothetical protein
VIGKIPPRRNDGRSSFHQLADYIRDARKTDGSVWVFNVLSVETAASEMAATAALSHRVHDPALHAVISWPTREQPTPAQAREAGIMALRALGFDVREPGGYQAMVALHRDTDHWHIHLAANRVHPESGLALHVEWSHKRLHRACREIELHQGWSHDRGLMEVIEQDGQAVIVPSSYRNPERTTRTTKAEDMEVHSGLVSFESYLKVHVGPVLKKAISGGNWEAVHRVLAEYGVELVPRGGGFAFREVFSDLYAKASAAGSFTKAANLQAKLGAYRPALAPLPTASQRYDPEALDGLRDLAAEEKVRRQTMRDAAARQRSPNRQRHTEEGAAENARQRSEYAEQRAALWEAYRRQEREQAEAQRRKRREVLAQQRRQHRVQRLQHKQAQRQERTETWAWWQANPEGERIPAAALRALIALQHAKEREQLQQRQRSEREALQAGYGGRQGLSWREWVNQQAESDPIAQRVQLGMRYRDPDEGQETPGLSGQGEQDFVWMGDRAIDRWQPFLEAVEAVWDGDEVIYRDRQRESDLGRDHGDWIEVYDQSDTGLEQLLRIAAARFVQPLILTGSEEFKRLATSKAAELGIRIGNEDPELQGLWAQVVRERARPAGRIERPGGETTKGAGEGRASSAEAAPGDYLDRAQISEIKRAVDLVVVAQAFGFEVDPAESTEQSLKLRRGEGEIRIVQRRSGGDVYFDPGDTNNNGDVIAFLRREQGARLSFQQAARKAAEFAGTLPVQQREAQRRQERSERTLDMAALRRRFFSAEGLDTRYLEERGFTPEELAASPYWRSSADGALLFAHRDFEENILGFEYSGRGKDGRKFSGFSKGGRKGLYWTGNTQDPVYLLITESGLDAESARKLNGQDNTLYLSTGGAFGRKTEEMLQLAAAAYPETVVLIGTDQDEAGDRYAAQIREILPQALDVRREWLGEAKDWNQLLQWQPAPAAEPEDGPGERMGEGNEPRP